MAALLFRERSMDTRVVQGGAWPKHGGVGVQGEAPDHVIEYIVM
jgi:hypothetical protein